MNDDFKLCHVCRAALPYHAEGCALELPLEKFVDWFTRTLQEKIDFLLKSPERFDALRVPDHVLDDIARMPLRPLGMCDDNWRNVLRDRAAGRWPCEQRPNHDGMVWRRVVFTATICGASVSYGEHVGFEPVACVKSSPRRGSGKACLSSRANARRKAWRFCRAVFVRSLEGRVPCTYTAPHVCPIHSTMWAKCRYRGMRGVGEVVCGP